MIELINSEIQTVAVGQRVIFDKSITHTGCAERHRTESGTITLVKPGKYKVFFAANITVPTGTTPTEVALNLIQDGDVLPGTLMRATPAAIEEYFNVSTERIVDVYCGSTTTISVANAGLTPALIDNPNIIIVRVA